MEAIFFTFLVSNNGTLARFLQLENILFISVTFSVSPNCQNPSKLVVVL